MALVNKQDPKKIFASQAPEQDVPAQFNNYERGWDESRKNNGKPTIKQFNKLQQLTDEKILWMHQNGAALPFDETMEYAEGAIVVKDGELKQKNGTDWLPVNKKDITASNVLDESGKTQQEVNDQKIGFIITPEMFGANADYYLPDGSVNPAPTDNLLAFQKMENYLYSIGGGTVNFKGAGYFANAFQPTDLSKSLMRNNVAESKIWYLSPNVMRIGYGTEIIMNGGESEPFGWGTTTNVLSVCDEEDSSIVLSVNQADNSVVVESATLFVVGDRVQLFRLGGNVTSTSIPNTPSRERAPCQILTISAISGTKITFSEKFTHDFKTRGLLRLSKPRIGGYANAGFSGFVFKKNPSSSESNPYFLMSRQEKTEIGNITFDENFGWSWGMSEGLVANSIKLTGSDGTIESTSNVMVNDFRAEANQRIYSYPLLLNDNCVNFRFNKYYASGYGSAIWCIFGVSGSFGEFTSNNCGTSETPTVNTIDGFALTLGMPKIGYYSDAATINAEAYKTKNLGRNSLTFDKLNIKGFNKGCVLAGDIELKISSAYIEYDPSADVPIFTVGDSGNWLNDDTYYTKRSKSSIVIDKLDIVTKDGMPITRDQIIGQQGGHAGLIGENIATVTNAALASDTSLKLDSTVDFYPYLTPAYLRGSGLNLTAKTVTSVTGNTINFDSAIGRDVAVGERVWTISRNSSIQKLIIIRNITINGDKVADIVITPRKFVTVPASGSVVVPIKAQTGFYSEVIRIGVGSGSNAKLYKIDVENTAERKQVFTTLIGGSSGVLYSGSDAITATFSSTINSSGEIEITISNSSANMSILMVS